MASQFEEQFESQATPLLMDQFADQGIIQQRKAQNFATNWPVRGIWMPDPPMFEQQTGQKIVLTGRLAVEVDEDTPLLETDQWVINEEEWQVDKKQGAIGTAQFGLRTIYLRRVDALFTKAGRETK